MDCSKFLFSDFAKISDFVTGLASATPILIMEDCNINKCPEVTASEFIGNYTCPSTGKAVHKDINLEETTTAATTEPTTTTTTTSTTTTTVPNIVAPGQGSGSTVIISLICLVFSMIL